MIVPCVSRWPTRVRLKTPASCGKPGQHSRNGHKFLLDIMWAEFYSCIGFFVFLCGRRICLRPVLATRLMCRRAPGTPTPRSQPCLACAGRRMPASDIHLMPGWASGTAMLWCQGLAASRARQEGSPTLSPATPRLVASATDWTVQRFGEPGSALFGSRHIRLLTCPARGMLSSSPGGTYARVLFQLPG